MISKTSFLVVLLVKTITSQRTVPFNYPQIYPETVVEKFIPSQFPPQYPMSWSENDAICKNLASAIQNVIFEKFSQNCLRTPVFGPVSGPLVNEIKNTVCTCPACSSYNVTPNGYSKSYVSPNAVSNLIKSVPNTIPSYPRKPNVSVNRNIDLLGLLKSLTTCDCGCRGPVV